MIILRSLGVAPLVALMTAGDPLGAAIAVKSTEDGVNRATVA